MGRRSYLLDLNQEKAPTHTYTETYTDRKISEPESGGSMVVHDNCLAHSRSICR